MSQRAVIDVRSARPMSIEDWASLPEDEPGELVDGKLVDEEVPDIPHEVVVSRLVYWL